MGERRSRTAYPPPGPDRAPAGATRPTHEHALSRGLRVALIGLAVGNVLTLLALALLAIFVYQDHQYVQGRGQYRDAEQAQIERDMRDLACGLLDALPADPPTLARARATYRCAPIPSQPTQEP